MAGVKTIENFHIVRAVTAGILLMWGSDASSDTDFTFPSLTSQPVNIDHVVRSADHYVMVVFNRSSKTIQGIEFVFAGTACRPPYKPSWPVDKRDSIVLPPNAHVSLRVQRAVIDGIAAKSMVSCGHAVPTEIGITHVRFADSTSWDIGDRVRAGERFQ